MLPLIAYTDRLSVAPGEAIEVKVGSYGARSYRADLRRIIQGDRHADGPGYKDEPVDIDLGPPRPGRRQAIRPGSYVAIEDQGHVLADLATRVAAAPRPSPPSGGSPE